MDSKSPYEGDGLIFNLGYNVRVPIKNNGHHRGMVPQEGEEHRFRDSGAVVKGGYALMGPKG